MSDYTQPELDALDEEIRLLAEKSNADLGFPKTTPGKSKGTNNGQQDAEIEFTFGGADGLEEQSLRLDTWLREKGVPFTPSQKVRAEIHPDLPPTERFKVKVEGVVSNDAPGLSE